LGDEPALTIKEWVEHIGRAAAWKGQIRVVSDGDLPPHLRSEDMDWRQDWVVDTGRIRRDFGYVEPIGLGDAFDRTVRWQRDHSPSVDPLHFDYAAEDVALASGCATDGRT
jgi:hypothetical protein